MKNKLFRTFMYALALGFLFVSCTKEEIATSQLSTEAQNGDIIPGKYIVRLDNSSLKSVSIAKSYEKRQELMKNEVSSIISENNASSAEVSNLYTNSLLGFSASLSDADVAKLKADKRVVSIESDRVIMLGKPSGGGGTAPTQQIPFGITRVNGGVSGATGTAWIIDSGIDLDHPDLNVDVARSVFYTGRSADDENGHGTHVAGTIAAINNTIGVIGVAAGAKVVAVRVLDRRGSGSTSGVIAGIDYVGANGTNGDVANMSLGGGVSTALDDAVASAAQSSGVIFCLASGNESDDALNHSPARTNGVNVFTISAMDINDNWAYFSNYGTPVDYCAPGVNILSTWKDGGYNTISGTSMATPHAAGVFLLGSARTDGFVNGDPDGKADPIIVH